MIEKLKSGVATEEEKNEIARQYLRVVNYYAQGDGDLISAGNEGLAYAIRNAHKIRGDNLEGWIFLCISRIIARARKKLIKGPPMPHPYYVPSTLYHDIQELCKDDTERTIVKKRVDGYKDDEIAVEIGLSASGVHRIRMKIKARFEAED